MAYRRKRYLNWFFSAVFIFLMGFFTGGFFVIRQVQAMAAVRPAGLTDGLPLEGKSGSAGAEERLNMISDDGREWYETLLVSGTHPIDDLSVDLEIVENGYQMEEHAARALKEMLADGRASGLKLKICSAYRSQEKQSRLFENKVNQYIAQGMSRESAEAEAAKTVARPGTSEHQSGLAVDLVSEDYQILDEQQENTREQKWLMENCSRYGFILRYPVDKTSFTGIIYEPWHYRYVGIRAAQEIMAGDVCLEEYLGEA